MFRVKGMIGEVKIYKRVLDSMEVAETYQKERNTTGDVIDIVDTTVINVIDTITFTDTSYISVTDTLLIDVTFENVSGVDEITTIKVYPNPAKEYIIVKLKNVLMITTTAKTPRLLNVKLTATV